VIKIHNIYKYAWFSDLAYVKWANEKNMAAIPADTASSILIDAANAAKRIPGDPDHPGVDNLGDLIFEKASRGGLGWKLLDFQPNDAVGFAASLFGDGKGRIRAERTTPYARLKVAEGLWQRPNAPHPPCDSHRIGACA